eukprot:2694636-Rhodomonas_salina.1
MLEEGEEEGEEEGGIEVFEEGGDVEESEEVGTGSDGQYDGLSTDLADSTGTGDSYVDTGTTDIDTATDIGVLYDSKPSFLCQYCYSPAGTDGGGVVPGPRQ